MTMKSLRYLLVRSVPLRLPRISHCTALPRYPTQLSCRSFCHHGNAPNDTSARKDFSKHESSVSSSSSSSSESSSDNGEDSTARDIDEERRLADDILKASLPFVHHHGWTIDAISKGAESLGYSPMLHGLFPNGPTDLVNHFYVCCNDRLEDELKQIVRLQQEKTETKMGTTEFIKNAVELRLRMNIEYSSSWASALALHGTPSNAPRAIENLGQLVDIIWYHAGDRSIDFNWYTKRGVLAAVYKATELCMLQDNSDDFQDSWSFLDRRLTEAVSMGELLKGGNQKTADLQNLLNVGFTTIQNLIGISHKNR